MTELDCTDCETALCSLSQLLSRRRIELKEMLSSFDDEATTAEEKQREPFECRMLRATVGRRDRLPEADSVIWFHGTRLLPDVTYSDGLLPTSMARPKVVEILGEIASAIGICSSEAWPALVAASTTQANYTVKMAQSTDGGHDDGPHGFLFRESFDHHHGRPYLELPEQIRELCNVLKGGRGNELAEAYMTRTRPAAVKFRSAKPCSRAVATAMQYVYWKLREEDVPFECSCGLDNGGVKVPQSDIIDVMSVFA
jgi:hypothetical protein